MKHLFKKLMWWVLIILIVAFLNSASFMWLIYNIIPFEKYPDLSCWESYIMKNQLNLAPNEYLSLVERWIVYLFMFVGIILSLCFLKWVLQDTLQQHRERAKEKRDRLAEKKIKEKINEN